MKPATKFFSAIAFLLFVAGAGWVGWFLYERSREMDPESYSTWLDTDPGVYDAVSSISISDLQEYAYAFDKNKYVDAIPGATRLPKIADAQGKVPAFRCDSDVFILTWKWVNASSGLAISDSVDFQSKIERLDAGFRVRHVSGSVYAWDLDLDTSRSR